jgi:phage terminase small subunit
MAAGSTKPRAGTAERRQAFVQAYLANGHNATQAAIAAGYSARTAYSQGQRLLKNVEVAGRLASLAEKTADAAELTTVDALKEAARIAYAPVPDEPLTWAAKIKALEMLFKHLGLYEKSNHQKRENLNLRVTFVEAPPRPADDDGPVIDGEARTFGEVRR